MFKRRDRNFGGIFHGEWQSSGAVPQLTKAVPRCRWLVGFTLVELLVVIAIIGVLVALLLPAIQAARESARRSQCVNNIKQIALAIHNFESAHQYLPPNATWGDPNSTTRPQSPHHHTWCSFILPYMEQSALANTINFELPAWGQPVVQAKVSNFICPSDVGFVDPTETHDVAVTNYVVSEGYHWWSTAPLPDPQYSPEQTNGINVPPSDYSGIFTIIDGPTRNMQGIRWRQVTDGLSNTMMVSEANSYGFKFGRFMTSGTGVPRDKPNQAVFRGAFLASGYLGQCCEGRVGLFKRPGGGSLPGNGGSFFLAQPFLFTPSYIATFGPNTDFPGPSSLHAGGILNVAFADGSVTSLNDDIDWLTWLNLNGREDGQRAQN